MKAMGIVFIVLSLFPARKLGPDIAKNVEPSHPTAQTLSTQRVNSDVALSRDQDVGQAPNATILVDGRKYERSAAGVNAAIGAAANGQTVVIPASLSLSGPVTMSRAGVTLQCANGVQLTLANEANSDMIAISASNTRITGCVLDGNSVNQTKGGHGINISSTRVDHIDIDHNQIQNTWREGIRISNSSHLRITQNKLVNNGLGFNNSQSSSNAFSIFGIDYTMQRTASSESFITITDNDIDETDSRSGGINLAANVANGVIQKWHIDGNTIVVGDFGSVVELGIQAFAGALPANVVSDGTVNGNHISGADNSNTSSWGISVGLAGVEHADVVVTGNVLRDTRATCIEGIGSGVSITGNSCDDTDGITVTTNAAAIDGAVVTGNVLTNGSGAYQNFAQIGISAASPYTVRSVVVTDNSILNAPASRACIYLNSRSPGLIRDSQIMGNLCQGQTSGMKDHAIVLSQSSNIAVKSNTIRDWVGAGKCGIIVGPHSVGNILSDNVILNATTAWQNHGTSTVIEDTTGAQYNPKTQSFSVQSEADGSRIYCTNCKTTNPCSIGGSGAMARHVNGTWVCN